MNQAFLYDLVIILCLCSLGTLAVLAAYTIGGGVWKTRFMIQIKRQDNSTRRVPGQLGELASLGMVSILLILVDYFTQHAFIYDLWSTYQTPFLLTGSLLFIGIVVYSMTTCSGIKAKESRGDDYCGQLRRGYYLYNFYSLVTFSFTLLLVVLIAYQFVVERQLFSAASQEIQGIFAQFQSQQGVTPEMAVSNAEVIYGRALLGTSIIMNQIGTLLLIIFTAFLAYFAMTFSPLAQIYEKGAVRSVHLAFIGSIAFVALLAAAIYFTTYSSFFDQTITQLDSYRALVETGGAEQISVYNEVMLDLHRHRGPTGFILTLTNESAWLVVLITGVRWLWGRKATLAKA